MSPQVLVGELEEHQVCMPAPGAMLAAAAGHRGRPPRLASELVRVGCIGPSRFCGPCVCVCACVFISAFCRPQLLPRRLDWLGNEHQRAYEDVVSRGAVLLLSGDRGSGHARRLFTLFVLLLAGATRAVFKPGCGRLES